MYRKVFTIILACFPHFGRSLERQGDHHKKITSEEAAFGGARRLHQTSPGSCTITKEHVAYTLSKIQNAQMHYSPYPHTVIEDIYSPDVYACMLEQLPPNEDAYTRSDGHFKQGEGRYALLIRSTDNNVGPGILNKKKKKWTPIPASPNINSTYWTEWARAYGAETLKNAWLQKFNVTLAVRSPNWQNIAPKLYMRMELNRDISGYAIGPHTDAPYKWITMLYYLPKDASMSTAGTQIVRSNKGTSQKESKWMDPKDKQWQIVKQAPFIPNTVMAFAICDKSWHAVPKVGSKAVRNTIQTFIRGVDAKQVPPKGKCPEM